MCFPYGEYVLGTFYRVSTSLFVLYAPFFTPFSLSLYLYSSVFSIYISIPLSLLLFSIYFSIPLSFLLRSIYLSIPLSFLLFSIHLSVPLYFLLLSIYLSIPLSFPAALVLIYGFLIFPIYSIGWTPAKFGGWVTANPYSPLELLRKKGFTAQQ